MALTVKKIERLGEGRYHDSHGLYLRVTKTSGKSWSFRYKIRGVERWLGLGPLHTFSLNEARARARKARQQLYDGIDPIGAKQAETAKHITFEQAAEDYSAKDDFAKLTKDDPTRFTKNDLDALKLAIEHAKRDRKEQIESMLVPTEFISNSWIEVALFAAYHCQMKALRLDSADLPPMYVDDPDETLLGKDGDAWRYGAHEAARLLKQMLACGVSKYHPDPVKAIEKAEH